MRRGPVSGVAEQVQTAEGGRVRGSLYVPADCSVTGGMSE
jgi:hypothetical protein